MLEQYSDQVIAAFVHDINPQESKTGDGQSKRIHEEYVIVNAWLIPMTIPVLDLGLYSIRIMWQLLWVRSTKSSLLLMI